MYNKVQYNGSNSSDTETWSDVSLFGANRSNTETQSQSSNSYDSEVQRLKTVYVPINARFQYSDLSDVSIDGSIDEQSEEQGEEKLLTTAAAETGCDNANARSNRAAFISCFSICTSITTLTLAYTVQFSTEGYILLAAGDVVIAAFACMFCARDYGRTTPQR